MLSNNGARWLMMPKVYERHPHISYKEQVRPKIFIAQSNHEIYHIIVDIGR